MNIYRCGFIYWKVVSFATRTPFRYFTAASIDSFPFQIWLRQETSDHKATRKDEAERIKAAGGQVINTEYDDALSDPIFFVSHVFLPKKKHGGNFGWLKVTDVEQPFIPWELFVCKNEQYPTTMLFVFFDNVVVSNPRETSESCCSKDGTEDSRITPKDMVSPQIAISRGASKWFWSNHQVKMTSLPKQM